MFYDVVVGLITLTFVEAHREFCSALSCVLCISVTVVVPKFFHENSCAVKVNGI